MGPEQDREQGEGHDVGDEHKGDVGLVGQMGLLGEESGKVVGVLDRVVDGDDVKGEGGEGQKEDGIAHDGECV